MDQIITADTLRYSITGFIILEHIIEIYLLLRQIKFYKNCDRVPREVDKLMSEEIFHKACRYRMHRLKYAAFYKSFWGILIPIMDLCFGSTPRLWNKAEFLANRLNIDSSNEIAVSCVFTHMMILMDLVKEIPFKVYEDFVLEEKHGFNRQTVQFFILDQLMDFIVIPLLLIPFVAGVVYVVQHSGEHSAIWLWLFIGITSFIFHTIYPILIAPLFDKYTPLEDGQLKRSIENLAATQNFPLDKIYVVEQSKRSAHGNAYLYGFWNSKRIILFDTILLNKGKKDESEIREEDRGKGCTDKQILGVLGHELGHWKHGHVIKSVAIAGVYLLIMLVAFETLSQCEQLYNAFGFESGKKPILVGLIVVMNGIMAPFTYLFERIQNIIARRFEYQADQFAHKLHLSEQLADALIKLHVDNAALPMGDELYVWWFYTHPTLLQRLNRLKELDAEEKTN